MIVESKEPQDHEEPIARYANYFEIGHNAAEFILDFGQAYSTAKERQHASARRQQPVI